MHWSIVTLTLALAARASSSQLSLGPEALLSAPVTTAAPYAQHLLSVASNGHDFLAIWKDQRSTIASKPSYSGDQYPLYASRIDGTRRRPTPYGVKLVDRITGAALVWSPAGYVAIWSQYDGTFSMLLNDDGVPLAAPKKLSNSYYLAGAATNGHTMFVLAGRPGGQYGYEASQAAIFDFDGSLRAQTQIGTFTLHPDGTQPMVLPDGSYGVVGEIDNCLTSAACTPGTVLTTVSEAGIVAHHTLAPIDEWRKQISSTIGDGRLLVAWLTDRSMHPFRTLTFRVFDLSGNPLTEMKTVASTDAIAVISGEFGPSVGWDGRQFLLAWQWPSGDEQSGEIQALRITSDGVVLDNAPVILSSTLGDPPRFASNGSEQVVAWDTQQDDRADIVARSTASFDAIDSASTSMMTFSAALQTQVALANVGGRAFAVWRESEVYPAIKASFVGLPPITISAPGTVDQETPDVAANGKSMLVVWRSQPYASTGQEVSRILAKRLSVDGPVLDTNPILIAVESSLALIRPGRTLSVASDGNDFLVVWPSPSNGYLHAARVNSAGTVLDIPIDVSTIPGTVESPRVLWNGSEYVVVWIADRTCDLCFGPFLPESSIYVLRINAAGSVTKTASEIWKGAEAYRMGVARGIEGLMLVWGVSNPPYPAPCVYAMPLGTDGAPVASFKEVTCTTNTNSKQFPDVALATNGANWVVAWTEITNDSAVARAARVSSSGDLIDTTPTDLAPAGSASFEPVLAEVGGVTVVAYDRIATEPQYGSVGRVFLRSFQSSAPRRRAGPK
jgi:hypothetical protein